MSNVSKEMVYAVKMARWAAWERMAEKLPRGRHILSVELLRTTLEETTVVITAVQNGKLVQFELRGDANGRYAKPFVSQRPPTGGDKVAHVGVAPRLEAHAAMAPVPPPPPADTGDGGPIANFGVGEPPPKEETHPGAIALGESLLGDTFNLGEQAFLAYGQ